MPYNRVARAPLIFHSIFREVNNLADFVDQSAQLIHSDGGVEIHKQASTLSISGPQPIEYATGKLLRPAIRTSNNTPFTIYSLYDDEWHTNEEIFLLDPKGMVGFLFADQEVRVVSLPDSSNKYMLLTDGVQYARFWLEEDLTVTSPVVCSPVDFADTLDGDDEINDQPIYAVWGGTTLEVDESEEPVPKIIGCFWNESKLRWEAGLENCNGEQFEEEEE